MAVLFTLLGLVVGGILVAGIIQFLPSKALGNLEKKYKTPAAKKTTAKEDTAKKETSGGGS